jgi:ubiquinone/menaquinone biosynthesis C-methylase UbiE
MSDSYDNLEGYYSDADLGLGCGLPTEFARISKGDTVVDLGSGAGNDVFVARRLAGESGTVIGIDFTDEMLGKARTNAEKLGYTNVSFVKGDIESMPLDNDIADVVISNCVLNLVPDKKAAFSEIYRILKQGGHFSVSDIVVNGDLPEGIQKAAEMYSGCVSGAISKKDYLGVIEQAGFRNLLIQKEKKIVIPDEILMNYLSPDEMIAFKQNDDIIYSITVFAEK